MILSSRNHNYCVVVLQMQWHGLVAELKQCDSYFTIVRILLHVRAQSMLVTALVVMIFFFWFQFQPLPQFSKLVAHNTITLTVQNWLVRAPPMAGHNYSNCLHGHKTVQYNYVHVHYCLQVYSASQHCTLCHVIKEVGVSPIVQSCHREGLQKLDQWVQL